MQQRIGRMLDALDRVDGMIRSRPELASLVDSSGHRDLIQTVADLKAHVVHQDHGARGSRGETARQGKLIAVLRTHMRGLRASARRKLRQTPDFAQFTIPPANAPVETLLQAANGMAVAAAKYEPELLQASSTPGFIGRLTAAADDVRASINGRAAQQGVRTNATAVMRGLASEVNAVLSGLDASVVLLADGEPGLLAQWNAAKRIGRKPGRSRTAPTPAATPAPTPEVTSQAA